MVDATYRSDLRELNELNFARFDAKLERRVAELDAKIDRRFSEVMARVDTSLAQLETRLTKRMFGFWIAQAATTAALVLGVVRLLSH